MNVYNLVFRLGMPLGALAMGKIIPLVGISAALAGTGPALMGTAAFFVIVMRDVPMFRRSVSEAT